MLISGIQGDADHRRTKLVELRHDIVTYERAVWCEQGIKTVRSLIEVRNQPLVFQPR